MTKLTSNSKRGMSRTGFWIGVLGATIIAAGLRLYHLDAASFWVDELNTIRVCSILPQMHKSKVLGFVPTAVGLRCHGVKPSEIPLERPETWRSMGITEYSARIGSCVVGIVSVLVLGIAGRAVFGSRVSVILALMLAVAPWHIYWSQASRFYSQQFLFYSLALIWYYRATDERSRGRFVAAMFAMMLAFLSQPTALIICTVFAADWLLGIVRRQPVRLGVFGWVAAVLATSMCAASLAYDVWNVPDDWTKFAGDLYQAPSTLILGAVYMIGPAVVLVAALTAWRTARDGQRILWYLVLAAIIPLTLYAIISTRSYVGLRYVFVCLYGWLALAALGTEKLYVLLRDQCGRALAGAPIGMLLVAMLLMDYGYFTSGAGFHTRWQEAFAYVAARRKPGEMVFSDTHSMIGRYYLEDSSVESIPKSADALRALDHPAWVIVEAEDVIRGEVKSWIGEVAELKAYFDLRVLQPYSSTRVYHYEPRVP